MCRWPARLLKNAVGSVGTRRRAGWAWRVAARRSWWWQVGTMEWSWEDGRKASWVVGAGGFARFRGGLSVHLEIKKRPGPLADTNKKQRQCSCLSAVLRTHRPSCSKEGATQFYTTHTNYYHYWWTRWERRNRRSSLGRGPNVQSSQETCNSNESPDKCQRRIHDSLVEELTFGFLSVSPTHFEIFMSPTQRCWGSKDLVEIRWNEQPNPGL